jgi:DNA-binding NarL/FixJ family response regulator
MSVRLLIADDHEVVRIGLRAVFAQSAEIQVVAEASDGEQAIERALALRPDVVLLDVRMPQCDGITCLGRLRTELPETVILMFSAYDNPTYIARAVAMGAVGYFTAPAATCSRASSPAVS